MNPLAELPDHAELRVFPAAPALDDAALGELSSGIDKLFQHFAREGRCTAWACASAAGGSILLVAAVGAEPLSGCSKDKLVKLLLTHEERHGRALLAAPPIVVETARGARCVDRPGLRALIAAGDVAATTPVYDLTITTLGDWRRRGRLAAGATWVGRLLPAVPGPH